MSDTPHGRHVQAVGFAGMEVERFERELKALHIEAEEVFGTIVRATGEDPEGILGRGPQVNFLNVAEKLNQAIALCEETKQLLNDYGAQI
jgi:hypothetical protein